MIHWSCCNLALDALTSFSWLCIYRQLCHRQQYKKFTIANCRFWAIYLIWTITVHCFHCNYIRTSRWWPHEADRMSRVCKAVKNLFCFNTFLLMTFVVNPHMLFHSAVFNISLQSIQALMEPVWWIQCQCIDLFSAGNQKPRLMQMNGMRRTHTSPVDVRGTRADSYIHTCMQSQVMWWKIKELRVR